MMPKRTNKTRPFLFRRFLFFGLALGGLLPNGRGQEKLNISGGIGFPELLNVALLYQAKQAQFGVSTGVFPYSSDFLGDIFVYAVTADAYYHFGTATRFAMRRPWFVKSGLTYFDPDGSDHSLFLNCRLGRDFNSYERNGFSISAGLLFELYNDYKHHNPGHPGNRNFVVFPGAGISLYYRLKPAK